MSAKFDRLVPSLTRRLVADLAITQLDAFAILGNLGHESAGFEKLQEIKPVVKGSRGGYGWAQWTGQRRRAYEAWCKQWGLNVASDEANYGFLIYELKTSEAKALPRLRAAKTLYDKVVAFELAYERAGVKHYDSRHRWAQRAQAAFDDAQQPGANVQPDVTAPLPISVKPKRNIALWVGVPLLIIFWIAVVLFIGARS